MTEINIDNLFCLCCNYKTKRITDWLKHIETEKHKRNGEKKKLFVQYVKNNLLIHMY